MESRQMGEKPAPADFLKNHILTNINVGTWTPGDKLPPERELAAEFGMARNTLRKVLSELERDGHLVRHIGRGTFVSGLPVGDEKDSLFMRMLGASPADVIELRLLLEPAVAALAAARATAEELREMENLLERGEAAPTLSDFEYWDAQLHLAIFRASKNQLLADYCDAINQIRNQPRWFNMKKRSHTQERRELYQLQHRRIVACLQDRDAEAANKVLTEHLQAIRTNMLEHAK